MTLTKIKTLIKRSGYKQKYVAELSGVTPAHLNKVLKGIHPLSDELKINLEKFLINRVVRVNDSDND